jgi:hypothetical protein
MNIEGTYKVNIEQTVRKIGESEEATIERMLRYVGLQSSDIPADPKKEAKIQQMISDYQQDELATTMRMEITRDQLSIRSTDGDSDHPIKSHTVTGDNRLMLIVGMSDDMEDEQLDITVVAGRFLVVGGEGEMSGFVWERT